MIARSTFDSRDYYATVHEPTSRSRLWLSHARGRFDFGNTQVKKHMYAPYTATATKRWLTPLTHRCCVMCDVCCLQVVAIRSSGTVMLKECYDNYVKADGVDPVSGKKFEEKDVVELVSLVLLLCVARMRLYPCSIVAERSCAIAV